ncbi:MAG TPA: hypothetical protein VGN38_03505 [Caulobacteraceae bacterium]|jgi:hypothetical protein|nr:hypothetical protein [Caulobacteraceae bacterium]
MRVLVAGILGGIAMFIWASVAHMATPLASIGLQAPPGGEATVAALHERFGDKQGQYFFPYMPGHDSKAMAAQMEKLKTSPSGLIVYNPPGSGGIAPRRLAIELGLEVIEAILMAAILAAATTGFGVRWGLAVLIGVIAAIATNFSYWNWYGFNLDYTLANAFTELVKFVVAGLVAAVVLGWRRRRRRG